MGHILFLYLDDLKLRLARLLYGMACRMSGTSLALPSSTDAYGDFYRLQAARMERIARDWQLRYKALRRGQPTVSRKIEV